MKRLYGHPEVTAGMVQGDLEDVTKSFNMMNLAEKREKLAMWKMRMNDNIGKQAEWINKKGGCLTPTVVEDGIEACSRNETVGSLFRYWHDLTYGGSKMFGVKSSLLKELRKSLKFSCLRSRMHPMDKKKKKK